MKNCCRPLSRGFTLLEVVISLAIAGMVISSIFLIARSSILSTSTMIDAQNEEIARDAFFSMMRNHFEGLPGNAVMDLRNTSSTEPFLSEMTFQNTPVSFDWGGVPIAAEAMRIVTIPTLSKGIDVVIEYYDVQILDDQEEGTLAERGIDPIASITLLEDVRLFEWSVLDGRNYATTEKPWPYEWDQPNRLPLFVELKVIFSIDDQPITRMFWLPGKTNPRTVMTQLQNSARNNVSQSRAGGGQQGGGGQPGGGGGNQDGPGGGGPGGEGPGGGGPRGGGPGGGGPGGGGPGGGGRPGGGGGPAGGGAPAGGRGGAR